jgi:hypothetical protein
MKNKIEFFLILFISLITITNLKYIVHIIPHSHDDPGWIKTFDEYYNDQVSKILTNAVNNLIENKNRTFVYSEISFFKKWWDLQNDTTKENVKKLVSEKRFEFVNGGYVMGDEATSYFVDATIQLRLGLEFLKNTFNITPHIAWLLDEFGHTMSHAYMYSQFGYDKIVLGRSTQSFKDKYYKDQNLNLYWVPFNDTNHKIFAHIIYDYYCPPKSIRNFCDDLPIKQLSNETFLNSKADSFYKEVENELKGYKHNQYFLFYGCDFTFTEDKINFENIETLMNYINMNSNFKDKFELKYSTVEKFFNEVDKELIANDKKKEIINYSEDFLPYLDWVNSVWTGFYTSRPYLKGKIRESNIYLLLSSMFNTEYMLASHNNENFYPIQWDLLHAVSICQHHDAITGTAKTNVSNDYLDLLEIGESKIEENTKNIIKNLFNLDNTKVCLSNGKVKLGCNFEFDLNNNEYKLGIINPNLDGKFLITIETDISNRNITFELKDYNLKNINYDMICIPEYKCYINFLYELYKNYNILTFYFKNIKTKEKNENEEISLEGSSLDIPLSIQSNILKEMFYNPDLNLFYINFNSDNEDFNKIHYEFSLIHAYFKGNSGEGAYIFNTSDNYPTKYLINSQKSFYKIGKISNSILLRTEISYLLINIYYEPIFFQTISVLDKVIEKNINTDVVLLLESNLINNNIFYSDNSGLKMVKRINDDNKNTSNNFYPVNKVISIRTEKNINYKINIYNDRVQGGAALKDGTLMLMLNRWTSSDDNKGVKEKLYEPQSSDNNFECKHIIELNYFNNDNKIIQKIAKNYFDNNLIIFYDEKNILNNNQNYYRLSKLNEYFIYSNYIKMQILYIGEKRILIQFINEYDDYFQHDIWESMSKQIISISKLASYNIKKCDINGFNCQNIINDNNESGDYIHYFMQPLDLVVFSIDI